MKIKNVLIIVLVIVVIGLAGSTIYFRSKYEETKKQLSNPQALIDEEGAQIISQVSKLMDLPNEEPTIATVLEADKLKSQEFFANTQNGDRVLIYAQAKKAILYRPSTNKIIEVSALNIGTDELVTPSPTPKIEPINDEVDSEI